tara:strand:+ start:180 stop:629 length:450 start_codon:yes stop_codon:yes gene_type:complete
MGPRTNREEHHRCGREGHGRGTVRAVSPETSGPSGNVPSGDGGEAKEKGRRREEAGTGHFQRATTNDCPRNAAPKAHSTNEQAAKDLAVEYIMQELYYGLSTSKADVPGEFQALVATGNPQMDSINHYNIVLACQRHLKLNHPEVFAGY